MFTGIVTDIGRVRRVEKHGDMHIAIETHFDVAEIAIGASIACAGVCLTVIGKGSSADRWFDVTASEETLSKTNLGEWQTGRHVNLERPLRVGDELGGHIVTGHIDGTAEILGIVPEGESKRITFGMPAAFGRFVAPKGSIALDGVSLTVNDADGNQFGVNLIPHTLKVTTLGGSRVGDCVNFEVDVLARYVARLAGA
ncbi:MAG TPA: riboflavin synthase [Rhizomicrobium sp.]|nr:riboflavin synthase [Rhizomicrobium sp.]